MDGDIYLEYNNKFTPKSMMSISPMRSFEQFLIHRNPGIGVTDYTPHHGRQFITKKNPHRRDGSVLLLVDSCLLHSGYLGREFIIRDLWSNISKCNNHLWHMRYPIFGRVKSPIVLYSRYSDIGAKFGVLGGA